jgi:hypothetical protein
MNKRAIQRATGVRIREVLRQELGSLENFTHLVTRKSVDAPDGSIVVCGSSSAEEWEEVEAAVATFWEWLKL